MTTKNALTFDRVCNGFTGKLSDDKGNVYEIILCDYKKKQVDRAEKQAEAIATWISAQLDEALTFAAKQLIDDYNHNRRPEDRQPLTWNDLRQQLELQNIHAYSDAGFELYLRCEQLFGEHLVQMYVSSDFTLEEVKVLGFSL